MIHGGHPLPQEHCHYHLPCTERSSFFLTVCLCFCMYFLVDLCITTSYFLNQLKQKLSFCCPQLLLLLAKGSRTHPVGFGVPYTQFASKFTAHRMYGQRTDYSLSLSRKCCRAMHTRILCPTAI